MRIAIDLQATAGQTTGFGRYVHQLRSALAAVAPPDVSFRDITTIKRNLSTPKRMLWDQLGLPLAAAWRRPDVLFIPAFSAPVLWPGKLVATCHDLIGRLFPQYFSRTARAYWHSLLPAGIRHADHVLVISESTKRDVVRLLGIPPSRISVTPLAVGAAFKPITDTTLVDRVRHTYNLPRPYCVAIGTIEPRKNYPFLVDAFGVAKREDHDLVIVGKRGWDAPALDQRIRQYHMGDRVRVLEYVAEADLVPLLGGATALLFPSRYEGFGLPVLEAMACGVPVVASTASSVPEVGGEAVLYADPSDKEAWQVQIGRIITDTSLRVKLREQGLTRAATFTWHRTAQLTLEALLTVARA
jgi:glycosyltransferase involved in cell wall biosynthesis